ncbi:MAG: HAD family hydrolase [Bdellovibrionales bacterium]|nr:HAD family hydrolase [Bdellovibrionales bacterium]
MMPKCWSPITAFEPHSVVAFDLDDTLYPERDFVESGLRYVAERLGLASSFDLIAAYHKGERDVFGTLLETPGLTGRFTKQDLLEWYRSHQPDIVLEPGVSRVLQRLSEQNVPLALITDGRSVTQRNKIRALGIEHLFSPIVISEEFGSEKPDERNFRAVEAAHPGCRYLFVADNPAKDFITPRKFGWTTICVLDAGQHIHPQSFAGDPSFLPDFAVHSVAQILAE